MNIKELLEQIVQQKEAVGGIQHVVWIAAGGSFGGFYPAQYFMDRESKKIHSQCFTSNEFVFATPKFVDETTLAVICSMRGTPETCEAAQVAKNLGASTISLYVEESRLTTICDYNLPYESIAIDESHMERINAALGLELAMTLTYLVEGYQNYTIAMQQFEKIDALYREAVLHTTPHAKAWALQNAKETCISVMASGPTMGAAYIFSICNIMEMLQINSPTINCCEFFHGPFETLNKDSSIFLLIGAGRCRAADERAVRFLQTYGGEKVTMLDAHEIGLDQLDPSVQEYFNHLLFSPILNNVYMRELSYVIGKDYHTRDYMWKVAY